VDHLVEELAGEEARPFRSIAHRVAGERGDRDA
jgi:hypothetical protein